jgi:hypothetical protein
MDKAMDEMVLISSYHGKAKQKITDYLESRDIPYQVTDIHGYSSTQGFNLWLRQDEDGEVMAEIEKFHRAAVLEFGQPRPNPKLAEINRDLADLIKDLESGEIHKEDLPLDLRNRFLKIMEK